MASEALQKSLQSLEFRQDLTPEQLEALASISAQVTFAEGQTVFRERDVGEYVYLIEEGQVALEFYVPGQGHVTILTLGPGQLLGWSSLLPSPLKTANARTITPTKVVAINAARLMELMETDKEVACAVLWRVVITVADRLKATRLQLLDIFASDAP